MTVRNEGRLLIWTFIIYKWRGLGFLCLNKTLTMSDQKMIELIILRQFWKALTGLWCYSAWRTSFWYLTWLCVFDSYKRYCIAVSLLAEIVMGLMCGGLILCEVEGLSLLCVACSIALPVTAQSKTANCCQMSVNFYWTPSAIVSGEQK